MPAFACLPAGMIFSGKTSMNSFNLLADPFFFPNMEDRRGNSEAGNAPHQGKACAQTNRNKVKVSQPS
jgi:hypothetical protein